MLTYFKETWEEADRWIPRSVFTKTYYFFKEIKSDIEKWVLLKTANFRFKHSKKLHITTPHLFNDHSAWDDVYINDQWHLWLPMGFCLVSRLNWESDNQINKEIGEAEEPWKDIRDCNCEDCCGKKDKCYRTYYYKGDYLTWEDYADSVRKQLRYHYGELGDTKDFTLHFECPSAKWMHDEQQKWIDWKAAGSPPFKVVMTPQAEADIKRLTEEDPKFKKLIDKKIDDLRQEPF